jgi:GntR family transcriptional regulator, transcriptional repressor for pyruvate dehydrogenase complex
MTAIDESASRQRPVQATTRRLREMVFAAKPDTRIGSLKGLAESLGVGIVTVQQAARILEHEGLLDVRRGPGGGYYGKRPDEAALQRSIAAFIRLHPVGYAEALDMMTLLFCELVAAAAESSDEMLHGELAAMVGEIDLCRNEETLGGFEARFQDLLFRIVDRPLFALLTRVALQLYGDGALPPLYAGDEGLAEWRVGRHRVLRAILARDRELARFEAERNRRVLLERFRDHGGTP